MSLWNGIAALVVGVSMGIGAVGCERVAPTAAPAQEREGFSEVYESETLRVTATVSPLDPTVADIVQFTLAIEMPAGAVVEVPSLGDLLPAELAVADVRATEPVAIGNGRARTERIYELEPFLPGTTAVPAVTVTLPEHGVSITTEPVSIEVLSVLDGDDDTLRAPIKGVVRIKAPPAPWWVVPLRIGAGVLFFAGAATLVVWGVVRWVRKPIKQLPPHELAILRLSRLENSDLLQRGDVRAFLESLSGILRRYMEARYGLPVTAQTTQELLSIAQQRSLFDAGDTASIAAFLQQCDAVKFARGDASAAMAQDAALMVRAFVERTAVPLDASLSKEEAAL